MIEGQRVKLSELALMKKVMRSNKCQPQSIRGTVLASLKKTPSDCERVKFDHAKSESSSTILRDFLEAL